MVQPPGTWRRSLFSRAPVLLATGFQLGRVPYAPGTVGSLAALLVFLPFRHLSWVIHLLMVSLSLAAGICAADRARAALAVKDPPSVIIDEIVGCWVAVLAIPPRPMALLCGFALFRLFDIWKPFPADRVQSLSGGWGIMLDDVVAGIYANLSVRFIQWLLPGVVG